MGNLNIGFCYIRTKSETREYMLHLKSYVGSIVLAALLLQGCGSSSDETATQTNDSTQDVQTAATITALSDTIGSLDGTEDDAEIKATFDELKLKLSAPESSTTATAMQTAGLLDSVKDGLVNLLDSNLGNTVTSATFDVVLNSEGVTVVMLDLARGSHTITKIMIDALEADWSLTTKMIPMLQTNKEFGEKFAALAYEEPDMARFFFSRVDAPMYGALADAMLLSNDDAVHDESVEHSTTQYMGLLMSMYATEYFVPHKSGANKITDTTGSENIIYAQNDVNGNLATDDNFVNVLFDTKEVVTYDGNVTFTGHGDGTELTNEKFFYALFKTPDSTNSFIAAMDQLPESTTVQLMDNIFLGINEFADTNDSTQGHLNIISIGSAMYDGIYGKDGSTAYGLGNYTGAFFGFAGLIPANKFIPYGKAFISAGYQYAGFHGINVWSGVGQAAQTVWNNYTTPDAPADENLAPSAPARTAGLGLVASPWYTDVKTLLITAYANFNITIDWAALYSSLVDSDKSIVTEVTNQFQNLKDDGGIALSTIIDGRDEDNATAYPTTITNSVLTADDNDVVYGFHGLIELAVREDMVNTGISADMAEAEGNFTLPLFGELTWSYAYGTAKDGVKAYVANIDADWIADLSTNTLVRDYFYPSADNVYIPSWMLAIDWLTVPSNYSNASIADLDFDFNSGYLDIYTLSTNGNLLNEIDITVAAGVIKTVTMEKVLMGDDSIIVVGAADTNIDGLHVYKIRVVSPEDTEAVLAYLASLGNTALNAIGIDTSNTADVDTTVVATVE